MRKINLILLLILTAFILQGCHHVFIHSTPGIRVRHTRVVKKPVYVEQEEYYEEDDQEYDEYEDAEEYEETEYVDEGYQDTGYQQAGYREYVETDVSVDIFVGTAFAIYGTPYIWCDYCCCWHPRCTLWRCYCHAVVIRHYGFYHNHRYMHHCYHWNYDPYYRPVISRFRIRHNTGRYYTYNVAQKQRDFRRRNGVGFSKERVRYRGKEEIKYTYNKSRSNDGSRRTVTRNGVSSSAKKTSVDKRGSVERSDPGTRRTSRTTREGQRLSKTSSADKERKSSGERSRRYERSKTSSRPKEVSRTTSSRRNREYSEKSPEKSSKLSKIGNAIKRNVPKISRNINESKNTSRKSPKSVKKPSKPKKTTNRSKNVTKKKGG